MELNWDGRQSRTKSYPPYFGTDYYQGSINGVENDNFALAYYNELLGLRTFEGRQAKALADWLRDAKAAGDQFDATTDQYKTRTALHVVIRRHTAFQTKEFWLDPDRDYMIIAASWNLTIGQRYTKYLEEALACSQIDGVWVPTLAHRRTATSASKWETEITYNLDSFKSGKVQRADVMIEYPAGSKIVDRISVWHISCGRTESTRYYLSLTPKGTSSDFPRRVLLIIPTVSYTESRL